MKKYGFVHMTDCFLQLQRDTADLLAQVQTDKKSCKCRHLWLLTPVRRFYHLGYSGCVYEKSWHLPVLTEAFFLLSCTLVDFRQPVGFYLYWHQLSYLCITAVVADLLVFQEVLSECFCVWINGYCMEFSVSWINVNHRSTGSNLKHHISICSLLTQWQCTAWM